MAHVDMPPRSDYWFSQLDRLAIDRAHPGQFHVFAEGMHSDARGQFFNLRSDEHLSIWSDKWPEHVFVILVVSGALEADLSGEKLAMPSLSQLVLPPKATCELRATTDSAVEVISFLSRPPS